MASFTYKVAAERTRIVQSAERLLMSTIAERTGLFPAKTEEGKADLILDISRGIGEEGFQIAGGVNGQIRIVGNDERGLLYGVGAFLRSSPMEEGSVQPCVWRGTSTPAKLVRGMYFATHFHNWYHDAPVDEIIKYVEELALWGCNALSVWFDMHHFKGISDPDAQEMLHRLRSILRAATDVGIRAGLTTLANEGYSTTPANLRAEYADGQNGYFKQPAGHYHVEICPSMPGGIELILEHRKEMLDAFADIDLQYYWIWPYDQGGCTCTKCSPWGANGFLRTAEPIASLVKSMFPQAKIILSTWYFDHFVYGEWEGLRAALDQKKPEWIDYLLIDDFGGFPEYPLNHGVPGGYPVVGFPEISMEGMYPWGGYGANPRPVHWQRHHDTTTNVVSGGFPYSEGIYEDLNKVLTLQLGWDSERKVEDIITEYASGYFSPSIAEDVVHASLMMEENDAKKAKECFHLMSGADSALTEIARTSWRWRVLWLRSALDYELSRTDGKPGSKKDEYLEELIEIYHAHNAEVSVRPPVSGTQQDER